MHLHFWNFDAKNAYISTTRSGLAIMIRNNAEEKGGRDGPESRI